jgi:hypothetical protein
MIAVATHDPCAGVGSRSRPLPAYNWIIKLLAVWLAGWSGSQCLVGGAKGIRTAGPIRLKV